MENVAGVAPDSRVGKHTAMMRTVQQLTTQLEDGAPPTKKARPQPLLLIIALELWVMNRNAARYRRAFAWTKLLKFWASSRSDDLLGLVPQCLQFRGRGLCGLLQRTKKQAGPARR